jgi:hypothetical protein
VSAGGTLRGCLWLALWAWLCGAAFGALWVWIALRF